MFNLIAVGAAAAPTPLAMAPPNSVLIAPSVYMPLVGLGLWQYNSSVAEAATTAALGMSYPLIDHALGYKNADGVKKALAKFPRSSYCACI